MAFSVPPQSVAIYNQDNGKLYMFDGVTKIQHTFSVRIDEEPDKKKEEYVNNARNQPDKLSIDFLMSDVYTDNGNMSIATAWDESSQQTVYNKAQGTILTAQDATGAWSRSGNAVWNLRKMKENRTKLSIITPQYVHVDMIIESLTVNQDDTCPYGIQGQIVFQHTFKVAAQKNNNTSNKKSGNTPIAPSISASSIGNVLSNTLSSITNFLSGTK